MAIIDEIQRITKAKQDFKTKLIEKGVTVSDDELISDYPPKLDLIKGGATITTKGGWQGTAVPNSGYVDKVYFNTELSVEEVVGILEQLPYDNTFGVNSYFVCFYADMDNGVLNGVEIGKGEDGSYYIYVITDDEYTMFTTTDSGLGFIGWNSELTNPYPLNINSVSEFNGVSFGTQNELLSSLISITPFVQEQGETLTLEGEYDGSTLVIEDIASGYPVGKNAVPNEGYVDKVYFNTDMSVEEVNNILSQLQYNNDGVYIIYGNPELMLGIMVQSIEGDYAILSASEDFVVFNGSQVFADSLGFYGWNTNIDLPLTFNGETKPDECYGSEPTIRQNDLLKDLIYTMGAGKPNTINIKALIEQKKIPLEIKVNVEEGANTSDATATANEIRKGFTAYVSEGKVEGAIEDYDGAFEIIIPTSIITLDTKLPYNIYDVGAAPVGTNIYIFYGKILKFDTLTEEVTTLINATQDIAPVAIGTNIYALSYWGNIRKYDTVSNTITTITKFNYKYSRNCAAAVGTDIYVFGGSKNNGSSTREIEKFDTLNDTVEVLSATMSCYNDAKAVTLGTDIYVFGGNKSDSTQIKTIYKFDTISQTVTTFGTLPYGLSLSSYALIDNIIYVFGGNKNGTITDTILKIDISNNIIEELSIKLPTSLYYSCASTVNGKAYIFGGCKGSLINQSNEILKFIP